MRISTFCAFALMVALIAAVAGSPATSTAATPPKYSVEDLGVFEVPLTPELAAVDACKYIGWGFLYSLNDDGVVAGYFPKSNFLNTPVVFENGEMTRYKTGGTAGQAYDVNSDGTLVGYVTKDSGGPPDFPCPTGLGLSPAMWVDGELTRVQSPEGYGDGAIYAINDRGVMLGIVYSADFTRTEWILWDGEETVEIQDGSCADATLSTQIMDLNNAGVAAGSYCGSPAQWVGGVRTLLEVPDGAGPTVVREINDDGTIVGYWQDTETNTFHPLIWEDGKLTELPLPQGIQSGFATSINSEGTVVGGNVVWIDGTPWVLNSDLTEYTGSIQDCFAVNTAGQIACHAQVDGVRHAVILTPNN